MISPLGDTAVTLEFGTDIDRAVNARVMAARDALAMANLRGVVETVPTFGALAVYFDPLEIGQEKLIAALGEVEFFADATLAPGRVHEVPVLYDGPDLDAVAQTTGLSSDEIVKLHSGADYHVYMLGFLPGFAYLGDLPEKLSLPRLKEPRTRVPRGSVGIAEGLTAVYPVESPGGWRLIGRTPLILFDLRADPPSLFAPGDTVSFQPIGRAEFDRLSGAGR